MAAADVVPSLDKVNMFLSARPNCPKDARDALLNLLGAWVGGNEVPATSPNFRSQGADEMGHLIKMAKHPALEQHEGLTLLTLKAFKILSRKLENRQTFGEAGIKAVLRFLRAPLSPLIAAEGANVILNVCYERENVATVLRCGGAPPLVTALQSPDVDLQANSAGAIQSICFQEEGRVAVREGGAVPHLITLLKTPTLKVTTRAVGALHNMSSDPETIRIIRRNEGIPVLIELLHSPNSNIAGSAAGALQNVSREVASRTIIRDGGAVPPLGLILVGQDMQAQVCAAGALLNILGPDMMDEANPKDEAAARRRKGFGSLLTSCLVMGNLYETLFALDARAELLA